MKSEIETLGGLEAYQIASLKGGSLDKGFGAAGKWLVETLRNMVDENGSKMVFPLKMLDIGAITGEVYEKYKRYLLVESVDLNSQSPLVKQQDFMERPLPKTDSERFQVIGLSLVLNFVTDPISRGNMLLQTRSHLLPNGFLYIVLPKPCIENSRYLTHSAFVDTLMKETLGFKLIKHHTSNKLASFVFQMTPSPSLEEFPKRELIPGSKRNNFCIVFNRD